MPIITLTTDFGEKDHFTGVVKGAIYTEFPEVKIVDISHGISPFNLTETAYILKSAYKSFPEGTVHIIGIDSELSPENKHIAVKLDEHYFVCADNGIISMVTTDIKPEKIVEINIHDKISDSFPVLNVFVKTACHIARGGTLEVIGRRATQYRQLKWLQPNVNAEKNQITGSVIYIDNYGNVITNISKKLFNEVGKGRDFEVLLPRKYIFNKIYATYSEAIDFSVPREKRQDDGKSIAIFNSSDYLEIAIYKSNLSTVGGAASLLGLDYRDIVSIKFK